jgi:hypothetical protein
VSPSLPGHNDDRGPSAGTRNEESAAASPKDAG